MIIVDDTLSVAPTLPLDSGRSDDLGSLAAPLGPKSFVDRYSKERMLGEGGMGLVSLHRDLQIGRRVAMKVLRPEYA